MSAHLPARVAAFVADGLQDHADEQTREWWTRYLKGDAVFRGVKMADTRSVARAVDERFELSTVPADLLFDVTDRLFSQPHTEDKLCATLLLGERHPGRLSSDDIDRLARPLERGHLADWNSCDWYCVKALGPFVARVDNERRARAIAAWCDADGLWQRRAAAVTFVQLVTEPPRFDGFHELIVDVCRRNVADPTRWSQTSVGWLLRELSKQEPRLVADFVDAHADLMSSEARRAATKHL